MTTWQWVVMAVIFGLHAIYAEWAWTKVRRLRKQLLAESKRNQLAVFPLKAPMGDTFELCGECKHCGAGCQLAVMSVPR